MEPDAGDFGLSESRRLAYLLAKVPRTSDVCRARASHDPELPPAARASIDACPPTYEASSARLSQQNHSACTERLLTNRGQRPSKPLAASLHGPLTSAFVPIVSCRRGDLNPHVLIGHQALNLARLPIPPLRRGVRNKPEGESL